MKQVVPDATEMRRYLEQGLTQQQIAEKHSEKTAQTIGRAAIGMAIKRYGLQSSKPRDRYTDLIPWQVKTEHAQHRDLRMLRLESRRQHGKSLSESELRRLEGWLLELNARKAVIMYHPETDQGFHWVHRESTDEGIVRMP